MFNTKSIKTTKSIAEAALGVMNKSRATFIKESAQFALVAQMKNVLANFYGLYFKAHSFHWNIEGSNFPQYHTFFETVYTQVYESVDKIAEQIRALRAYAPTSLKELLSHSLIAEPMAVLPPQAMIQELLSDNEKVIYVLTVAYKLAEQAEEVGLSNFLQDLIDKHKKLSWMITSTAKGA